MDLVLVWKMKHISALLELLSVIVRDQQLRQGVFFENSRFAALGQDALALGFPAAGYDRVPWSSGRG